MALHGIEDTACIKRLGGHILAASTLLDSEWLLCSKCACIWFAVCIFGCYIHFIIVATASAYCITHTCQSDLILLRVYGMVILI